VEFQNEAAPAAAAPARPPLRQGVIVIRQAPHEYEAEVRQQIGAWLMENRTVTLEEVLVYASPDQPALSLLCDFAVRQGHKAKDFQRRVREEKAARGLGALPRTASHFVELLAAKRGISVRANGVLHRCERPYMDWDIRGETRRCWLDERDPDPVNQAYIAHHFRHAPTLEEFLREARVVAADFGLPFGRDAINDAALRWHAAARHDRLERIKHDLNWAAVGREAAEVEAGLLAICRAMFDLEAQPAEYAQAAVKKFIWQVKRKLYGVPVTDHAMVVLLGRQRTGKSTFMRDLVRPVEELAAPTDFREITDTRNTDLWSNLVLVLDEMGWAGRADIDVVKNAITAETFSRRIMHTGGLQHIRQMATFLGAANKESLSDLIRDPTGLRRFIGLRVADRPDWGACQGFDWSRVWRGVDYEADDPMLPFADLLAARQEAERERSHTEAWLETLHDRSRIDDERLVPGRKIAAETLYRAFRLWEDDMFPRQPSSNARFGLDLKAARALGHCPLRKAGRSASGNVYEWEGRPAPANDDGCVEQDDDGGGNVVLFDRAAAG
jgi:Virulence-associated protein E